MLAHHIAALLSVLAAVWQGQAHMYTLCLLATEVTTPCINMRWWLDKAVRARTCEQPIAGHRCLVDL